MSDDGGMLLFSWLAVPVLVGGAVLLTGFWLRQRCRVPVVMLAVAVGFWLLAAVISEIVVYLVGIRDDLVFSVVLVAAIGAVCAETLLYLSFLAGRAMRANHTIGGALMVGLGYGGMNAIVGWVDYLLYLLHYGARPISWVRVGLFVFDGVVFDALVVIVQLGLATLVVLAHRRSLLFLPLAVLAGFAVGASTRAFVMVHSGMWALLVCWAVAAMVLVALVHRSGWLTVVPRDETTAVQE